MKTIGTYLKYLKELFAAWKRCIVDVNRAFGENWLRRILILPPVVVMLSSAHLCMIIIGAVTIPGYELKCLMTKNYRLRKNFITKRRV